MRKKVYKNCEIKIEKLRKDYGKIQRMDDKRLSKAE